MQAGKLRHRADIQKQASILNAYGEPASPDDEGLDGDLWETVETVWASIIPKTGTEVDIGDTTAAIVTHSVVMRYTANAQPNFRLRAMPSGANPVAATGAVITITAFASIDPSSTLNLVAAQTLQRYYWESHNQFYPETDNETTAVNLANAINAGGTVGSSGFPQGRGLFTAVASVDGSDGIVTIAQTVTGTSGNSTPTLTYSSGGWEVTTAFSGGTDTRFFGIESVINEDERNEMLTLLCIEQVD